MKNLCCIMVQHLCMGRLLYLRAQRPNVSTRLDPPSEHLEALPQYRTVASSMASQPPSAHRAVLYPANGSMMVSTPYSAFIRCCTTAGESGDGSMDIPDMQVTTSILRACKRWDEG